MKGILAAWSLGCVSLLWLPQLPLGEWWLFVVLPVLLVLAWRRYWRALALCAGVCWSLVIAQQALSYRLPLDDGQPLAAGLYASPVTVDGEIIEPPQRQGDRLRFLFRVERLHGPAPSTDGLSASNHPALLLTPRHLRVDWYRSEAQPASGEYWRLQLRLRPPWSRLNDDAYDLERQWLAQGIDGSAIVQQQQGHRLSETATPLLSNQAPSHHTLASTRQRLATHLQERLTPRAAAIAQALLLGQRGELDESLWTDLRRTGTSHLLAISGLHIGMVASLGLVFSRLLIGLWPAVALRIPRPLLALWCGVPPAALYAFLTGFQLPTQRALVMLLLTWLLLSQRRQHDPWLLWLWALAAVLAVQPLAVLGAGLWLSFGAVAALIYAFHQRTSGPWWRSLLKAQAVVTVMLLPLAVAWFHQVSIVGGVTNLLAVPWVTVVVLPLGLLTLLALWLGLPDGMLLSALDQAIVLLLRWIEWTADWPGSSMLLAAPGWAAALALVGGVWLCAPRGMPLRPLALLLMLPLFSHRPALPEMGDFQLYQFDVGQGTAIAIRTRNHLLLYDSGPGDGHGRDLVAMAMLPQLLHWGAPPLDLFLISHGDLDHAGGRHSVEQWLQPRRVLASTASAAPRPCQRGRRWQWDGVDFALLHPGPNLPYLGNNSSCVLRISGRHWSLLLPGDLSHAGEQLLLQRHPPAELRSTVLAVGHHGSRSSTTSAWLEAVQPQLGLLSRGYFNRFGFPHADVSQRLREARVTVLDSALCGGLMLGWDGRQLTWIAQRQQRRWWRQQAPAPCPQPPLKMAEPAAGRQS